MYIFRTSFRAFPGSKSRSGAKDVRCSIHVVGTNFMESKHNPYSRVLYTTRTPLDLNPLTGKILLFAQGTWITMILKRLLSSRLFLFLLPQTTGT